MKQMLTTVRHVCLKYALGWFLISFLAGCATLQDQPRTVALVDGQPITEEHLLYALNVAHRVEGLSGGKAIDLVPFVQKMINDRLLADEALRMGLDQTPEVRDPLQAYTVRESVVRLYNEEVIGKISVSDTDVLSSYKADYIQFGLIEVMTEKSVKIILEQLKLGTDFQELARTYSQHSSSKAGGTVIYPKVLIIPVFREALEGLQPLEFSDILTLGSRFYLVKRLQTLEPPGEGSAEIRDEIRKKLYDAKKKENSESYLKVLRDKTSITIDQPLLNSIRPDLDRETRQKLASDKRTLAQVNTEVLTIAEFMTMMERGRNADKEKILNNWINIKVVDLEALSRNYDQKPGLREELETYRNTLVSRSYVRRVIVPQLNVTDEELKEFYQKNQDRYRKPAEIKTQRISVKASSEAEKVLESLQKGADFLWIAKSKMKDPEDPGSVELGWRLATELPEEVRQLQQGEISPVIETGSSYEIYKVMARRPGELTPFEGVRDEISRIIYSEKMNAKVLEYIATLREQAEIEIFPEVIHEFEERFQRPQE